MNDVLVVAIGNGVMEKEDQQRIQRAWREAARRKAVKDVKKLTPEQQKVMLATMGVKVIWPKDSATQSLN